jgi:hypothetical protein
MANDLGDSNEHLKFTRKRILILKLIFKKRWFIIYLIDLYKQHWNTHIWLILMGYV